MRLVRQLLTESLLLAMVAGTAGVVMAYWSMDLIMAFAPPVDMPLDLGLRMDGTTLMFAVGVSVITGVIFGLAPALQASSAETITALKEEGRSGSGGRTTGRLRNALVVAQVAVCLVLLVGATLFLRSFIAAQSLSPGFDADRLVTASMDMFPSGYTGERNREFQRRALEAVARCLALQFAAFGSRIPLGFGGNNSTTVASMAMCRARTRRSSSTTRRSARAISRRWASRSAPAGNTRHRHAGIAAHRRDQRGDGAALLAGRQCARQDRAVWHEPRRGGWHRRRLEIQQHQ